MADLRAVSDTTIVRFQELVAAKYSRRLTRPEQREMQALQAAMEQADAAFYAPILGVFVPAGS